MIRELDSKRVYVMLSNHNTILINELYKDYNIHVIEAKRNINSNGKKRGKVEEVIITNYVNNTFVESSNLADVATTGDYDDLINKPTILNPTTLFDNQSGTTAPITLSDSIENYDYIEIYYKTNDAGSRASQKFYPIGNSNRICLAYGYDDGTLYYKTSNIVIGGTSLTFANNTQYVNFSSRTSGDYIYITDITGRKMKYKIYNIYEDNTNENTYITRNTEGKKEITLSTYNSENKAKIIILASEVQ